MKMIGRTFDDPTYMSTSLGDAAFSGKEAVLRLSVPEAIGGLIVGRPDLFLDAQKRTADGYAASWGGLFHLASGVALGDSAGIVGREALLGSASATGWLDPGVRGFLKDWNHQDGSAVAGTFGGFVGLSAPDKWWGVQAWDGFNPAQAWVDNPGGAAGPRRSISARWWFRVLGGSSSIAEHASGSVRAYIGDVRPTSVWIEYELPRLLANPDVTSIQVVDATTGRVMKIYER
jgi:hypothetical protein